MKRKKSVKDLKIEEQASYIRLLKTQLETAEEKLSKIKEVFEDERQSECEGCEAQHDRW